MAEVDVTQNAHKLGILGEVSILLLALAVCLIVIGMGLALWKGKL